MGKALHPIHAIPNETLSSRAIPRKANRSRTVATYCVSAAPLAVQHAAVSRMTEVAPAGCLFPHRRIHITVRSCAASDDGRSVARNPDFGVEKISWSNVAESA